MTPKPEIFRYVAALDAPKGRPPTMQDAARFRYDAAQHGQPTTAKLAQVAAQIVAHEAHAEIYDHWARRPLRFWIWRDDGVSYGSIEVALDFEPSLIAMGDTLRRPAEEVPA